MIIEHCQRFTEKHESRRPAGETIQTSAYDVAPIASAQVARDFVARHHYAGTSSSTAHRFGLYCRGELVGVALFGPPASMNAHRKVFPTLEISEAVTLGRFVLVDAVPGNGESWFKARCHDLLRERGIVAVESCADPLAADGDALTWLRTWRERLTRPMRHRGNHRYVWCLDRRRRREVLPTSSLPYPKFEVGRE